MFAEDLFEFCGCGLDQFEYPVALLVKLKFV
jgi:hypothetical protein